MIRRALFELLLVGLAGASGASCQPRLDDRTSRVDGPRLVAVRSEPAEVTPGGAVRLEALVVDGRGAAIAPSIAWAFCSERKPLAELGPVSPRCFDRQGPSLVDFAAGTAVDGIVPSDACRLFGPEVPPPAAGESGGRPVDPDATGGFYQPLRLIVPLGEIETTVLERTRISCGVAGTSVETLSDFRRRYRPNTNPAIDGVVVVRGSGALEAIVIGDGAPPHPIARGERLTVRVRWAQCPAAPCAGREPYVVFDPAVPALVDRLETMTVSWLAAGGTFAADRTAPLGGDPDASENAWTASDSSGPVNLLVVLRDDRGGVGWASLRFDVK